ncbi:unnamed protein product [Notodromas monacha]|uniref:Phospholipid/glycerol acyltransferase domain-containing protein n=1 Tax=Notodromas monacha TaxID=399045 RepID=A0A7R9BRF0_9CRUS|nr:unnamed protein product [Notodromas monacha]CAG0918950.1 unnamed protein product [Notodromas monacha]
MGSVRCLHHVEMMVWNASKRLEFLQSKFGFTPLAESRRRKKWAVSSGNAVFVVGERTPPTAGDPSVDSVTDAAFWVSDIEKVVERVRRNGGRVLAEPRVIVDEFGVMEQARVKSIVGNVEHTLVNPSGFRGCFMPGFRAVEPEPGRQMRPLVDGIDHVTFVCDAGCGAEVVGWYEACFGMKRLMSNRYCFVALAFLLLDEFMMHGSCMSQFEALEEYNLTSLHDSRQDHQFLPSQHPRRGLLTESFGKSSGFRSDDAKEGIRIEGNVGLRLRAMEYWKCAELGIQADVKPSAGGDSGLRIVVAESLWPQKGNAHVEEFLSQHSGPGIQHIGLRTHDICWAVRQCVERGVRFRRPPASYYNLESKRKEIARAEMNAVDLAQLGILIDAEADPRSCDLESDRFLLQIFTHPLFDEETFFLEIIQRRGALGFGEGNVTALALSIDLENQRKVAGGEKAEKIVTEKVVVAMSDLSDERMERVDDANELCPSENSWRHRFSRSRTPERSPGPVNYPDISGMFDVDRFSLEDKWRLLPLAVWFPFGSVLALVRVFMCFHVYLAALMLPQPSFLRRFVLRWMWTVMGLVVTADDEEEKPRHTEEYASLLVSNHGSPLDTLAVHMATDAFSPHLSGLPLWFRYAYGWSDFGWRENDPRSVNGPRHAAIVARKINEFVRGISSEDPRSSSRPPPVHIMPEGYWTNGRIGLLKFQSWWVSVLGGVSRETSEESGNEGVNDRVCVRPLAISWWRPSFPCPLRVTTINSSSWTDLFWIFFCPVTFVQIRFLPAVWRNAGQTNAEEFSSFVSQKIAAGLRSRQGSGRKHSSIVTTPYTTKDRDEYLKRMMFESISVSNQSRGVAESVQYPAEIMQMAERVKEVIPTVPLLVIASDLVRTGDINETMTNFLEGHVSYAPEIPTPKATTGPRTTKSEPSMSKMNPKNSPDRPLSFQERKVVMIEEARQKYIAKHIKSDPSLARFL